MGAAVAAFALSGVIWASTGVYAQSQGISDASTVQGSDSSAVSASAIPASYESPPKKTLGQKVKAIVAKITPERIKRDLEFKKAAALFPSFCQHWQEDLHQREVNNLSKLKFTPKDGYETTTYTGYGKISACESHQSRDGYSIGKITYEEFTYYLVGKSEDEARQAPPKPVGETHTTEIFRWENDKWFY
jgi:hypothetical protein